MLNLKKTASLRGLRPEMAIAIQVVADVYRSFGYVCTLTSGTDSKHGTGSLHYVGLAADFRTRHIPNAKRPALAEAIREALGSEFDVVLKARPAHIHVEFQPKTP